MPERSGILSTGCILVDVNKRIDRYPPEQEVALIAHEIAQCGGPGLNIALDLARLGAGFPIAVAGVVGDDANGRHIRKTCADLGIDHTAIRLSVEKPTSYTDVMIVAATARRTFFHAQGANAELAIEDVPLATTKAKILHVGSPGLHDALDAVNADGETGFVRLLKDARGAGLKTNLELVSLPKDRLSSTARPLLPFLSTIVINDHEAEALTGVAMTADGHTLIEAAKAAASALFDLGVADAVAIHFPAGAIGQRRGEAAVVQPSVQVPEHIVVSSNGAGDAFAAGMMLGLHDDWPMADCLKLGHASAATSLMAASTFEGVQPWRACLDMASQWGWRSL